MIRLSLFRSRLVSVLGCAFAVVLAQGCSSNEAAAADGVNQPVTIVHEKRFDHPDQHLAFLREVQQKCMDAKTVVSQATGTPYDPASDRMSDGELMQLDTEVTEEYFDGGKYARIVNATQIKADGFGSTPGMRCKFEKEPVKSVEIHDGNCYSLNVEYDMPNHTGRRVELKNVCSPPEKLDIAPKGEAVAVPGTNQQCRWAGEEPLRLCLLSPKAVHAGTGRPLVAIQGVSDQAFSAAALPGASVGMQAEKATDYAKTINIGGAIPAEKFKAPADSMGFPLSGAGG